MGKTNLLEPRQFNVQCASIRAGVGACDSDRLSAADEARPGACKALRRTTFSVGHGSSPFSAAQRRRWFPAVRASGPGHLGQDRQSR